MGVNMSDQNTTRIDHSAAIAAYAKAKNIDTTRAGKLFRSRLRSSFATLAKADPKQYGPKGAIKREANDRRPWGSHSRTALAQVFPEVPTFARKPKARKSPAKPESVEA